jgi:type VI secretion system secreted protein VgrG
MAIKGDEPRFLFSDKRLEVLNFSGSEGVSELYHYQIDLVSTSRDLSFDEFVDNQYTLTIMNTDGEKRYVTGICTRFEAVGFLPKRTVYRATIAPMQARMNLRRRLKVWQEVGVKAIITEVLGEWAIPNKWDASDTGPRDYCVQYRETDWDYCCRLLEEEGIAFYFEHADGVVTTCFIDNPNYPPITGKLPLIYQSDVTMVPAEEFVHQFVFGKQMRMTGCHLRDYNFKKPRMIDEAIEGKGPYELYDYPGEHMTPGLAATLANFRIDEAQGEVKQGYGHSNCVRFVAGHKFKLGTGKPDEIHPRKDLNIEYLLMNLTQSGTQHQVTGEEGAHEATAYGNSFRVIPFGTQWRPPRTTPRPIINSVVPARVTGPAGEEIYVDEFGRVKVWFFWDLPKTKPATDPAPLAEDEKTRCWIRVSHGWAGIGYGQFFLPRVGQEVLVSFIDGDPDRPIITGRVFNAEQTHPLPAWKDLLGRSYTAGAKGQKDHTVMRSKTYPSELTKGKAGFNEIRLIDTMDKELVRIRAQLDMHTEVERDSQSLIKRDRLEKVKRHQKVNVTSYSEHTGDTILIEGKTKITLKVGGSTIEMTPMEIKIKATMITSEAGAIHTIKGALVKIN